MAEVGAYYVTVMPNMSRFNSALAQGAKKASGIIGSVGLGTALGNALSTGFNSFLGTLDRGVSRLDTLESFPRIMENVGIDSAASERAINYLADAIDGLPTSLDDAAAATQRFALQNGDVERSAELFNALNNALLAGGQSAELQSTALEQVSQAYSKGKPDMMEWRSMLTTMGPALKMVARSWGMSVDDMGEALRDGSISMDDFLEELVSLNETGIDEFASLEEQASVSTDNLGTAIDLIGTRFSASWAMILDAIGRENLVGLIDGFTSGFKSSVETYLVPAIEAAMDWFDRFSQASQPIVDAFGELVTQLQNQVAPVFDTVSQAISDNAPSIDDFVSVISGAIDFLSDNLETIETVALAFAAFSAISALVPVFTAVAGAVTFLGTAFTTLLGAGSIAGALLGIVATIGTVPTIIAAVAGAVALLIMNWEAVTGFLAELGAGFAELVTWIDEFFGSTVPNALDSAFRAIGDVVAQIPDAFGNMVEAVKGKFDALVSFVRDIPNKIVDFFKGIGGRITSAIGSIKFPTPHVTWETLSIAGMDTPVKLPHVSWYGMGGLVNGAQLIGVGERGTELVWPSYGAALDKYASAIASRMPYAGNVTNLYVDGLQVNDDERIRADVLQLVTDLGRYGAMNRG